MGSRGVLRDDHEDALELFPQPSQLRELLRTVLRCVWGAFGSWCCDEMYEGDEMTERVKCSIYATVAVGIFGIGAYVRMCATQQRPFPLSSLSFATVVRYRRSPSCRTADYACRLRQSGVPSSHGRCLTPWVASSSNQVSQARFAGGGHGSFGDNKKSHGACYCPWISIQTSTSVSSGHRPLSDLQARTSQLESEVTGDNYAVLRNEILSLSLRVATIESSKAKSDEDAQETKQAFGGVRGELRDISATITRLFDHMRLLEAVAMEVCAFN